LKRKTMSAEIKIPDLDNDEIVVRVIDELKFRLKARMSAPRATPIAENLNDSLNALIDKFRLGDKQHSFAEL